MRRIGLFSKSASYSQHTLSMSRAPLQRLFRMFQTIRTPLFMHRRSPNAAHAKARNICRPYSPISSINIPTDHLPQLVFLGKLPAQDLEIANQALAAVDQSFFGADFAVGLNSELKGGEQRVRDYPGLSVCVKRCVSSIPRVPRVAHSCIRRK